MYNLRVVVEEVRGFCDLPMTPGDYFEVRGGRITIPEGKHMCLWAMSSLLPMFPAKQRNIVEENDWIPSTSHMCCPDPNGMVIFRIERVGAQPSNNASSQALEQTSVSSERLSAESSDSSHGASAASVPNKPFPRMLVNEQACSGCRACETTCSFVHSQTFSEAEARIRIEKDEANGRDIPRVCRQCGAACCVEACPAEALSRDPNTKAILLNKDLCTGCKACSKACSFSAIYFSPDLHHPLFCDLCQGDPQCVERCATGALTFGRAGEVPLKGGAKAATLGGVQ
ncbi:MAG: TIGR04076 family protein [Desulfitobacteriaceae bacterium]